VREKRRKPQRGGYPQLFGRRGIKRLKNHPHRKPFRGRSRSNRNLAIRSGQGELAAYGFAFSPRKSHTNGPAYRPGLKSPVTPRWRRRRSGHRGPFHPDIYLPRLLVRRGSATTSTALRRKIKSAIAGNPFTKAAVGWPSGTCFGKSLNTPVYRTSRGRIREFVPTKWSVSGRRTHPGRRTRSMGRSRKVSRCMKVKVGGDRDSRFWPVCARS